MMTTWLHFSGIKILDTVMMQDSVLALTDLAVLPTSAVLNAVKMIKNGRVDQIDPLIVTQASLLGELPVGSSSLDIIILMCKSTEFIGEQLLGEVSRVLKPDGTILLHLSSETLTGEMKTSPLERKFLVAGFLDVEVLPAKPALHSEAVQYLGNQTRPYIEMVKGLVQYLIDSTGLINTKY
ncbi:unnamed protein product [Thlaspi arvense]|uniref:Methyltransferase type 11 domain-containing protein n=1 Tax=Thlaspi arvense TaxID=13288 RepID=A0AAU9RT45_THLAR|nr:unnamed protein product [Thlaspi arvense]